MSRSILFYTVMTEWKKDTWKNLFCIDVTEKNGERQSLLTYTYIGIYLYQLKTNLYWKCLENYNISKTYINVDKYTFRNISIGILSQEHWYYWYWLVKTNFQFERVSFSQKESLQPLYLRQCFILCSYITSKLCFFFINSTCRKHFYYQILLFSLQIIFCCCKQNLMK